jgi:hypothetical protein
MFEEALIDNMVAAIERLKTIGDSWGWPSIEIAHIAFRRWESYSRRHKKAHRATNDERILDLAKGLQAHFEPNIPYTHPTEWRTLATVLAEELRANPNPLIEQSPNSPD